MKRRRFLAGMGMATALLVSGLRPPLRELEPDWDDYWHIVEDITKHFSEAIIHQIFDASPFGAALQAAVDRSPRGLAAPPPVVPTSGGEADAD